MASNYRACFDLDVPIFIFQAFRHSGSYKRLSLTHIMQCSFEKSLNEQRTWCSCRIGMHTLTEHRCICKSSSLKSLQRTKAVVSNDWLLMVWMAKRWESEDESLTTGSLIQVELFTVHSRKMTSSWPTPTNNLDKVNCSPPAACWWHLLHKSDEQWNVILFAESQSTLSTDSLPGHKQTFKIFDDTSIG